jgi:ribose 5-phosphate isomerase A
MKELVAREIARRVKHGDVIGVGTGSTVDAALSEIGKRVAAEGLSIHVVPSSYQSAWRCQELGLQVMYSGYRGRLSWGFDGADQVNRQRWAIKGKGGALLQEKILARRCNEFVIIVDETKLVENLGQGCPIPVEVIPEGISLVEDGLKRIGATELTLRSGSGKHGPVITERGNVILDAAFPNVHAGLEGDIKGLVGVVDSGLFVGYVSEVLVASSTGITSI